MRLMNSILMWAVLVACTGAAHAASPHGEVGFYIELYGQLDAGANPSVARADAVFDRVRRVADGSAKRSARLVVVDSDGDPWAIALPDGHIVLSRRALDICAGMAEHADACLAFVLGHELAHLANDDFWHREVHGFLAASPGATRINAFINESAGARERELAADDRGYVYASLAGYDAGALLAPGQPGFFEAWMAQTNSRVSATHADAATRAELLRGRLADLRGKLGFFEFGTRLAHFDYCDDAVYFLREFQRVFPGREVLSNLGFCHLQMARQSMSGARAYLYWMPHLLDGETRAAPGGGRDGRIVRSLAQAAAGQPSAHLEQAIEMLRAAAGADKRYLPAHLNLAVAQLYAGQPHAARASLQQAREIAPDDSRVTALDAVALYEQGDADLDLWPKAVGRLEKLLEAEPNDAMLRFNLARLLLLRPRAREARGHFNELAMRAGSLPGPIRTVVCKEQTVVQASSCTGTIDPLGAHTAWRWPLQLRGFSKLDPAALAGWERTPFDWYKSKLHGHIYRRPDASAEVLELDGFVQMQVLRGDQLGSEVKLRAKCAGALRQRSLGSDTAWSCGNWAALTRDGRVVEVWWVAR